MSEQLTLITLPAPGARPVGRERTPVRPRRPGTAGPRRTVDHAAWLDRRTIESGRHGLAAARAALADANRRAHRREQERDAQREAALARQADVIRHPASRHGRAA